MAGVGRFLLAAALLLAGSSGIFAQGVGQTIPRGEVFTYQVRDSTGIQGTARDTTHLTKVARVAGAAIWGLWVRAHGAATCDTTDVLFYALRSPDGQTWGAAVLIDSLKIYGSRADTLYHRELPDSVLATALDARLITLSRAGVTDTTGIAVWWDLVWVH